MDMQNIPFSTTDWAEIPPTQHPGETGVAYWRTRQFGAIRVRMVEYSPGYLADHWCDKGHILLCLEGELHTELQDGRKIVLTPGSGIRNRGRGTGFPLRVGARRDSRTSGARLFIVD